MGKDIIESDKSCTCTCEECLAGDCSKCSCKGCHCEGCDCRKIFEPGYDELTTEI